MARDGLKESLRRVAEYFGLAGQIVAEEASAKTERLEAQVEALQRRVAQQAEDIDALRTELIRLRAKL